MNGYARRCSYVELLEELRDLIDGWRFREGFRAQRLDESVQLADVPEEKSFPRSYLSVKLASSIGNSSNRSGRLCDLSTFGEESSSPSSCVLLKTSCRSSSIDFLGYTGEAMVLARLLLEVAGDAGGS